MTIIASPRRLVGGQHPALEHFRAPDERFHSLGVKPVQHQHLRARQKSAVQLEGRIFGGGAHEDDRAVLDIGQKRILLRFVEAVDFIHEEQRAAALLAPDARLLEDFLQVGDA